MNKFIHRYATPLTTGLFIVSAVSGVALFFRWAPRTFHSMHEWLSMLWLLPFVFHAWKNWPAVMAYARRGTLVVPLALSLVIAVPFAYSGMTSSQRGSPAFRVLSHVSQASIADLAPVLKTTPQALLSSLKASGFEAAQSADQTLAAIAQAAGKQPTDALAAIIPAR